MKGRESVVDQVVVTPRGRNPLSPHYDDMIEPWLRGESVGIAWSRQSVKDRAKNELTLLPG